MTKPKTQRWEYNGGRDAVEVRLPTGRWITVRRGESVTVLPNEAKPLKTMQGWNPAPPNKKEMS